MSSSSIFLARVSAIALGCSLAACGSSGSNGGTQNGQGGSGAQTGTGAHAGSGGLGSGGGSSGGAGSGGSSGGTSGGNGGTGAIGGDAGAAGASAGAGGGGTGGGGNLGPASWVYYKEWDGGFFLVDAAAALPQPVPIPGHEDLYNHPRFSPDGASFAINSSTTEVTIWSLAGSAPSLVKTLTGLSTKGTYLYPPYDETNGPWLNDNRLVYYANQATPPNEFRIVDLSSGQSTKIADAGTFNYDLSPDRTWMAWRTDALRVAKLGPPSTPAEVGVYDQHRWSPDSKRLAARKVSTGKLDVYDLSSGVPSLAWSSGVQPTTDFAWSSVGSRLAYTSTPKPGSGVYLVDFASAPTPKKVADADATFGKLEFKWSESGKLLIVRVGFSDALHDGVTGGSVTPAAVSQAKGSGFRLSPDDRWLFWQDFTSVKLSDLSKPGSSAIAIAGEAGVFAEDSKSFVNNATASGATSLTYDYYDLSAGTPKKLGSFNPPDKFIAWRRVGDVRYLFWIDDLTSGVSELFALPIVNGALLAPKRISSKSHFVYNGFSCIDCKLLQGN